jgi:outer membrane lipoprotein-sorting protein
MPAGLHAATKAPADLPACTSEAEKPDVAALLRRAEIMMDGKSTVATMTMAIQTESWKRTLKMKTWTKGRDYALIRVIEGGPRETGMMTLKREKQLWNYLPQAGRVMKLPSGMMGDSWMGSDFTNDDLVGGNSLVSDFDAEVSGTLKHEGRDAWRIMLKPRPTATVVWEKIEMIVDRATCLPLVQRFYDEGDEVARTMTFSDLRSTGWRQYPARMSVKPADSARETVVTYERIEYDVAIPDSTFSLHRLQQGR